MNLVIPGTRFEKRTCTRNFSHIVYRVCLCLALILSTCWIPGNVVAEEAGKAISASVVSDISIGDNAVKIKVQGPIKYTVYKSADPFTVVVEIGNASVGQFRDKIVSTVPGVTEIVPTQVETPSLAARFTILLQSPSDIKAEVKDDTLILSLGKNADQKQLSEKQEPVQPGQSGALAITDVSFDKDGDTVELIMKANGKMPEPIAFQLDSILSIEIPGVSMKATIPSKLPAGLKELKVRTEKDRLKFDIVLADGVTTDIFTLDDEVVVDIVPKNKKSKKAATEQMAGTPEKLINGTKVISLDFQDADIVPIFRLLGDVGGYNIVVHPDVKGKITMKLMNVPWDQAMDIILKTFNLEKVVEGNIIRIATVKDFQEEKKSLAETKDLFGKAENVETRIFRLKYANPDKWTYKQIDYTGAGYTITYKEKDGIKTVIEKGKVLSPRGSISADERTRIIIVSDIPSQLDEVQRIIDLLDKPTQQVLIEARIVEMSSDYVKSLGVDWGLTAANISSLPGTLVNASGSSGSVPSNVPGGGVNVIDKNTLKSIGTINIPSVINLPATTSTITSPTSAVTFGLLNSAQTLGLNLRISAIEDLGKAKIVSNPKIMTFDNQAAEIKQGKKIPVTTLQSTTGGQATFSTIYYDANLRLIVTPQVAPNGTIQLKVDINKDQPDFIHKDQIGNPAIDTKQASTQLMMKDGETMVIGGIMTSTEQSDDNEVPGLGKIPVLGALFKTKTNEKHTTELLIFVTPRIVEQ